MLTNEQAQALLQRPQSPLFAVPNQQLQHLAGDVLPGPQVVNPLTIGPVGNAMIKAEQAIRSGSPNVVLQPPDRYRMWLDNLKSRYGVR